MAGHIQTGRALVLLLAALLLRAAIPDGYMPAARGSGLLFELCPSTVPSGFMTALSGSGHHAHHGKPGSTAAHLDPGQCPIGHLLTSAVAVDVHPVPSAATPPAELLALPDRGTAAWRPVGQRSRSPPS